MMIRAFSTRKDRGGYKKLDEDKEEAAGVKLLIGKSKSVHVQSPEVKTSGSVHPLLSFFDLSLKRKKKTKKKNTTIVKPEFVRYLEYVKEGGTWDSTSNGPVIYYR